MNNLNIFLGTMLLASAASAHSPASHGWGLAATESVKAQKIAHQRQPIPYLPLIAIIDTGADKKHSAIKEKLWINSGETGLDKWGHDKENNGIDDDNNGLIDDVNGWNFVSNSPGFDDSNGHGTHIAGIVSSVAPLARLMILKYYDPQNPSSNLVMMVKAIRYAIKMKADVINFSAGGFGKNPEEERALREAEKAGVLVVAAAGNEGLNSDTRGYYPADYSLPNIISVASLDKNLNLLPSSNFGPNTVDIAAPGGDIISSLPGELEGAMTGTSQATAFVTGAAALLLAEGELRRQPLRLKEQIIASGAADPKLNSKTKTGVRLNSYQALVMKSQRTTALGRSLSSSSINYWAKNLYP
jgi:thermitase